MTEIGVVTIAFAYDVQATGNGKLKIIQKAYGFDIKTTHVHQGDHDRAEGDGDRLAGSRE